MILLLKDNGLENSYSGGGYSLNENSPIYRKLRHSFMLGNAEGKDGYINANWSAWYYFVDKEIKSSPGISAKEAKKIATAKLAGSIASYNPIFFSENSEKGKIHTVNFLNQLTPKYATLVEEQVDKFDNKIGKFWRDINRAGAENKYPIY